MIINDHYQNYKVYGIPKAQLLIADIPYNIGKNAYGSNPSWYVDGDNKNGESDLAGKEFFDTDIDFRISEFLHFCSKDKNMKKHLLLANSELSKAYDYAVGRLSELLDSDHVDGVLSEFIHEVENHLGGSFENASVGSVFSLCAYVRILQNHFCNPLICLRESRIWIYHLMNHRYYSEKLPIIQVVKLTPEPY